MKSPEYYTKSVILCWGKCLTSICMKPKWMIILGSNFK